MLRVDGKPVSPNLRILINKMMQLFYQQPQINPCIYIPLCKAVLELEMMGPRQCKTMLRLSLATAWQLGPESNCQLQFLYFIRNNKTLTIYLFMTLKGSRCPSTTEVPHINYSMPASPKNQLHQKNDVYSGSFTR